MTILDPYTPKKVCEYHSPEWMQLVEQRWVTALVDEMPDGRRYATMVYNPKPWWDR